jgi:SAM-dependent methyltransferase
MTHAHPGDTWNRGDPYEAYVGRWSRLVADRFLLWLDLPLSLRWLDVGCGTGALTAAIQERCRPARLVGIDPSDGFLAKARARLADAAAFHVATASALPFGDREFDVTVSGLAMNFFPDPAHCMLQMRRVTVAGGTIAVYVWDYAGKMEFMRHFWDAAVELSNAARELDEGIRFPLCRPGTLHALFGDAGLSAIRKDSIDIPTRFPDFDDFWNPFLGGQGPAPSYAMSLGEASRERLRERIRQRLPIEPDGSISLIARAWVIQGRVPG